MNKIIEDIKQNNKTIAKMILSDSSTEIKKIVVRPIEIRKQKLWQIERFIGTKVFHENVEIEDVLNIDFSAFKQICIQKTNVESIYCKTKSGYKLKTKEKQAKQINLSNNKTKNYLINEGDMVPAMVDLGIFTKEGKIINSMYDKFKQINHFIELIDHAFKSSKMEEITILDFGCGKSYLTFLIYHYFVNMKKIKAKIIGYDIKEDVVKNCNQIAQKYGYDDLKFELSDVSKDELYKGKIDMVITLHACDTATDYAIEFAIKNRVKYIFSVPCCQHEINLSINKGGDFDILMNDGLIKERFSSLLTDSIRVEILRAMGYSVDVIEFVDFAHSPKNLMIRATKNSTKKSLDKIIELKNKYKFNQKLLEMVACD